MKVLIFFIAFILGGMAGIVTMCLVQINRESEAQLENATPEKLVLDLLAQIPVPPAGEERF